MHGYRLGDADDPAHALAALLAPPRRAPARPGLHPGRAPTIVAGSVILVQVMRAFELDEIEVSERDILHGSALSAALAPA